MSSPRTLPLPSPLVTTRLIGKPENWRVRSLRDGTVIAVEPGGDYENVFTGGADPYWDAVQYAARQLRERR